ncbi:MAG: hypothetical protein ACYTF7_09375 [Planctomycetota bacterium]|jgi:hypothetical protein
MISRTLAILVCLSSIGCASTKAPTFAIESFSVTERSDNAAVLAVNIVGTNNSATPLELREVVYTLSLPGQRVTTSRDAQATLPVDTHLNITLPVVIDASTLESIEDTDTPYSFRAKISYLRPGKFAEVLYDLGIKKASRSFAETSTLHVPAQQ